MKKLRRRPLKDDKEIEVIKLTHESDTKNESGRKENVRHYKRKK